MKRILSKALITMGIVFMVAIMGPLSGCDSSGYYSCYDYYGYNYYYCNSYIYDPFYPGYGYSTAYYGLLAPDEYAQADTTQAERTPEANINVEHLIYIAKTSEPTEDDLTPADFEEAYPCGQGDKALTVCADEDAALDASDRIVIMFKTEGLIPQEDPVNHFVLGFAFDADNNLDNNFVPAQATIDGDTIVVSSEDVKKPVAVRYGWSNAAEPNLANKEGLPASSFRTDNWPGKTHNER